MGPDDPSASLWEFVAGAWGGFDFVSDSVRPWLQQYGVMVLAFGLFAETFFLTGFVIPGAALLLTSGYLVADGTFSPLTTVLAAWGGAVCGDQAGYWFGRLWGNRLLAGRLHQAVPVRQLLERQGNWLLLLYHYVPWFRTLFPVVTGSSGYHLRRWMLFDTIGVLLWVAAMLALGYTAYSAVEQGSLFKRLLDAAAFLIILVMVWRMYRAVMEKLPVQESPVDTSDKPTII